MIKIKKINNILSYKYKDYIIFMMTYRLPV